MRRIDDIARADWDALVRADAAERGADIGAPGFLPHPFVRHDWLGALERTGCASADTGWTPTHLVLRAPDGTLAAAAIVYAKDHSWGEYVFDHAWADAHHRSGLPYYPKLVGAIPFTPVRGPRLLARDEKARAALGTALRQLAASTGVSSAHLLFPETADEAALDATAVDEATWGGTRAPPAAEGSVRRWLRRTGVQFHWSDAGWGDFDTFLGSMSQPKRKKIRAERRKVAEAGVSVRIVELRDASKAERRFYVDCYERTYLEHGGPPYLDRAFWRSVFDTMPEHFALVIASHGGERIASSLIAHDGTTAWGRYWGATARVPCLHFEVCYYAPIVWALTRGLRCFEGGAQGEHKLARGLLPVETASRHWLAHPAFESAIDRWLARERAGVSIYLDELDERSPLK